MSVLVSKSSTWAYLVVDMDDHTPHHSDDTSTWSTGPSPFGKPGESAFGWGSVATAWPIETAIWLRRDFLSTVRDLTITIAVEDTCQVWVNGNYVGASPAGGVGHANIDPPVTLTIPASFLVSGTNDLAIRASDEVGGTSDVTFVDTLVETLPILGPAPPCRLFPRSDGLGVGGGRTYPPPKSRQRSARRFGYY